MVHAQHAPTIPFLLITLLPGFLASTSPPVVAGTETVECSPPALVRSERARDVHYTQVSKVTYVVTEPYPATRLLRELVGTLRADGWEPLDYDPLNPHLEAPAVHRWTTFLDAKRDDEEIRLEQWREWYGDAKGNRLMLLLQYTSGNSPASESREVSVVVSHHAGVAAEDAPHARVEPESRGGQGE